MRIMMRICNGKARIDFDPRQIDPEKIEEIYNYFMTEEEFSEISWKDNLPFLRNGVVMGMYNTLYTTDKLAESECKKAMDFISGFSNE